MTRAPLQTSRMNIRSRWLQSRGSRMHRISEIVWEEIDEMIQGRGTTVCGIEGQFRMPGIFSRIGAPRCPACGDALGIPRGDGIPFNAFNNGWEDA